MPDPLHKFLAERTGVTGALLIRNFTIENAGAIEIDRQLRNAHDIPKPEYDRLINHLGWLCPTRELIIPNLVVLSGRAVMARMLIGDTEFTGAINYGALGSGSAAPDASDTVLDTEVARKLFARRTRTNAQCNFDFFYSMADTDGTYEEFGMFIDGTASADSGQLFNRALTGGWAKTDTEAMTVSVQININAS